MAFQNWKRKHRENLGDKHSLRPEVVKAFIEDGRQLGAVVEGQDRWILQSLIDYWANWLYSEHKVEVSITLARTPSLQAAHERFLEWQKTK